MDKQIRVYSTPTCHYCHDVKEFLTSKGVPFETIDVKEDIEARKYMVEKSGSMGVPVTEINGEFVVGFDMTKIEELLQK